jgi:peptidyl-prolyl cis-trans isomerase C
MTFKPARLLLALIAIAASFTVRIRPEPRRRQRQGHPVLARRRDRQAGRGPGPGPDSPQLREAIKKDLIAREVMMQEAIKQGYDKNPEVKQALENARQTIVVNALARDYITKHPVTDAEIKAEYDRFTKQTGDKEYHVRHILVDRSRRQGHHRQAQGRRQVRRPGQAVEGHRHRQQRRRPRLGQPVVLPA